MCVKPVGPIWKRVKEAQTDDSLGTDFSFQPSMSISLVKSQWCQCVSSSCHSPYCCEPVTLLLSLPAEEREGERKEQEQQRVKESFFHLTQWMSRVSTPLDAVGESWKRERAKAVHHLRGANCTMNWHPPMGWLGTVLWLRWQSERASWRTGQHRTDPTSGHRAAVLISTRVALDLLTGRVVCVYVCVSVSQRESWRCLWAGVVFLWPCDCNWDLSMSAFVLCWFKRRLSIVSQSCHGDWQGTHAAVPVCVVWKAWVSLTLLFLRCCCCF